MKHFLKQVEQIGFKNIENTIWMKGRVFCYVNSSKDLVIVDIAKGVTPVYQGDFGLQSYEILERG